jgi:hypothetical protein
MQIFLDDQCEMAGTKLLLLLRLQPNRVENKLVGWENRLSEEEIQHSDDIVKLVFQTVAK